MTALTRQEVARQTVEMLEHHNMRLPVKHERTVTDARLLNLRRKTMNRQLPAWLEELRPQLLSHVVMAYEAGAESITEFRYWRISIKGEPLTKQQRERWKKEAAHWLELLLTGPVPGRQQSNGHYVHNFGARNLAAHSNNS